jgi:drug/metabolite transporter (DMT)-like permease
MVVDVLVSLIAALLAALCYGAGAVMQAIAVRASSRRPVLEAAGVAGRVDPGLLIRMLRQWLFLLSMLVDLIGFAGQLVALRRLPLFEVQVIIAANLAVTAVFASWLMHIVLSLREWVAVAAVVLGVGLLGSSAGAQGAAKVGVDFHLGLIAALALITVAGLAAARLPSWIRTPTLGAVAGLGYGVVAVCARILPGFSTHELVRSPAAYTLVAAGILSFMMYASALESGSVTVATAAVILVETVPPAIVGVLLLGDTTRPGMTGLAIAGFVMALVSAVALARFGEASGHDQVERAAQAPSAARAMTGEAMTGHPHVGRPQAGQADIGQAEIGQAEAGTSNSGTSQGRVDDTGIGQTSQQTGAGQASQVLADRPALVAVVSVQVADGGS